MKTATDIRKDREKTHLETVKHIVNVQHQIYNIQEFIRERAHNHDTSKLNPPEFDVFVEFTPKLATSTYGSEEYYSFLEGMKPALDHHYKENRHHPEHFIDGVNGMNLVDLIEMLCDWKAATMRHNDGDILKSIEINARRFSMSPQLTQILRNSVELLAD